jgi:hypothetical protein
VGCPLVMVKLAEWIGNGTRTLSNDKVLDKTRCGFSYTTYNYVLFSKKDVVMLHFVLYVHTNRVGFRLKYTVYTIYCMVFTLRFLCESYILEPNHFKKTDCSPME